MNAKKFVGATSREVLHKVKRALGDDAVIITNRTVGNTIEVLALPAQALGVPANDVAAPAATHAVARPARRGSAAPKPPLRALPPAPEPHVEDIAPVPTPFAGAPAPDAMHGVIAEIQRMRGVLQSELAALAVSDLQRRNPAATGLLGELLCAGFSPALARGLTAQLPPGESSELLRRRVSAALERRLAVASADDMIVRGGVYALVGPTGAGKTTTIAKLAARGVMRYGASGVALLTTDSYRIAAQDQLRVYGKILGVTVHPVKDASDLVMLLGELRDKRLMLIDTIGMSQRDRLVANQSALLAGSRAVQKILLLNATSNVATLEQVVSSYAKNEKAGCIITKIDEAAGLAPVTDICARHGLMLHFLTNGQRVPEDIHLPNRAYLLHRALRAASSHPSLTPAPDELALMMAVQGPAAIAGGARV